MLNDNEVERALVITAHPDDLDFAASGTIAAWSKSGIEVSYCISTNGDAGGFDPMIPRRDIPGIRQAEQRAAGAVVGVKEENIHFLGYHDGKLTPSLDLRRDMSRLIRQIRPQRVMCQSSERDFKFIAASHPDHLAAGEAALCAVYPDARNPFAHPELLLEEGLEDWKVLETWVMTREKVNHAFDITDTFEQKLAALRAHESQTSHNFEWVESHLREWGQTAAADAGWPDGRLAEGFCVIDTA